MNKNIFIAMDYNKTIDSFRLFSDEKTTYKYLYSRWQEERRVEEEERKKDPQRDKRWYGRRSWRQLETFALFLKTRCRIHYAPLDGGAGGNILPSARVKKARELGLLATFVT